MSKLWLLLLSYLLMSGVVKAGERFDATSYEIMQNCLAEAENLPNSGDYVQYCIDSYLSTQQIFTD